METPQIFKLPITYLLEKQEVSAEISADLELYAAGAPSLYAHVFLPQTIYAKNTLPLWAKYYTADKAFLRDSQQLLCLAEIKEKIIHPEEPFFIWQEIQKETGFNEKYHYVEWAKLEPLNNSASFLQMLSIYNMTSPIISLMLPIFFLIFPFK